MNEGLWENVVFYDGGVVNILNHALGLMSCLLLFGFFLFGRLWWSGCWNDGSFGLVLRNVWVELLLKEGF